MIKFLLYFVVLTAFIPLASSGKIKLRALRHASENRNMSTATKAVSADDGGFMIPFVAFQDSLNNGGRKRIKEVGRSKPQAIPEKVDRPDDNRPEDNPDRGNARPPIDRPSSERNNLRPGGRPPGGMSPGGARPQPPPPRRGR